jgi:hypothetical protein
MLLHHNGMSDLKAKFFLIASEFYLGFAREMGKRRFTTSNSSAGNKSRVEWTCKGPWDQPADKLHSTSYI